MAKDKTTDDTVIDVREVYSKTEHFIEENQKIILGVVSVLLIVVIGFISYKKFYVAPREKEAQALMFFAEHAFQKDSFELALNGVGEKDLASEKIPGNSLGFLDIIDQYGSTDAGNLSKYYTGISYLQIGEFQKAIDYLQDFDTDDILVGAVAQGATGDAYLELGDSENAMKYYTEAADFNDNNFTTPIYLKKAGFAAENSGKLEKALQYYERIKKDYFDSNEAKDIAKYIARVQSQLN